MIDSQLCNSYLYSIKKKILSDIKYYHNHPLLTRLNKPLHGSEINALIPHVEVQGTLTNSKHVYKDKKSIHTYITLKNFFFIQCGISHIK